MLRQFGRTAIILKFTYTEFGHYEGEKRETTI